MNNQTNCNYVHGTAACSMEFGGEQSFTVSYGKPLHSASTSEVRCNHGFMSADTYRNIMGSPCSLSKAQYALGSFICLAGALLMVFLERIF